MKVQLGSVSNANRFKKIIVICVLLLAPSLAHSQAKQLVDMAVSCKESVGNSFVFQFKEAIRTSASYTLTPGNSAPKPTLFVDIVCVDVSRDTSESATAVSAIVYTFRRNKNKGADCSFLTNVLLYHGVRYITQRLTKESAMSMLADILKSPPHRRRRSPSIAASHGLCTLALKSMLSFPNNSGVSAPASNPSKSTFKTQTR